MAEREGFEPSVPRKQYTGLAVQHLKPLSHLSTLKWREEDSLAPCPLQVVFRQKRYGVSHRASRLPKLVGVIFDNVEPKNKIGGAMGNDRCPNIARFYVQKAIANAADNGRPQF